jgi:hypothetical protein
MGLYLQGWKISRVEESSVDTDGEQRDDFQQTAGNVTTR